MQVRIPLPLTLGLAVAAGLVGSPFASSALSIDEFVEEQQVSIPIGPPTLQMDHNSVSLAGGLGGQRVISQLRVAGFGSASVDVNRTEAGRLSFSTGPGVVVSTAIRYGGFAPVDLTDGGLSRFLEISARSDLDATIRVHLDSAAGASFVDFALLGTGTGPGDPFQFLNVRFEDLRPAPNLLLGVLPGPVGGAPIPLADLTAIEGISVEIHGPPALDLQIDFLRTVAAPIPEPGTLVLLSLGVAVLAARRSAVSERGTIGASFGPHRGGPGEPARE